MGARAAEFIEVLMPLQSDSSDPLQPPFSYPFSPITPSLTPPQPLGLETGTRSSLSWETGRPHKTHSD
uniref:Uncharacterized protein n=1 Tax=Knipowitschia caucasica TaxID=637954 RepID=A0AAV2MS18_KNICA